MAKVFRLPARQPSGQGIAALCARLRHLEKAESPDEATMDAIAEAEQGVLGALTDLRSGDLAEVAHKLAAVSRRAGAADGFLCDADFALLASALRDLRRFDLETAVA